jgi:tetratricopeptide (TPR) repeat protein
LVKKSIFALLFLFLAFAGGAQTQLEAKAEARGFNQRGVGQLEAGDPFGAIKLFIKACRLSPFDDRYAKNLAYARFVAGKMLLARGEFEPAEGHLALAIKQEPDNAEFNLMLFDLYVKQQSGELALAQGDRVLALTPWDGELVRYLAINAYRLQQSKAAIAYLEGFVASYGVNLQVNKQLGSLLYERGRLTEALEALKPIESYNLKDPEALALISKINTELVIKEGLQSFSSEKFVLWTPKNLDLAFSELLSSNLEKIYEGLGDLLNFYPLEPVEVILLEETEYKSLYSYKQGATGVYDGKLVIPVARVEEPEQLARTLRHEYVHHLVYWMSEDTAPLWLNEGLAQLLETDDLEAILEQNSKALLLSHKEVERLYLSAVDENNLKEVYKWSFVKALKIVAESGLDRLVEMLKSKTYAI